MPPAVPALRVDLGRLFAAGLLLAGCGDAVVLGGECRPLGASCPKVRQKPDEDAGTIVEPDEDASESGPDAAPPRDAGGDVQDAMSAVDAGAPDAGPGPLLGPFPTIQNGSFEVTAGPATGGTIGGFSGTQASPWAWCGGTVEVRSVDGDLMPTDGATFAKLSFGTGPGQLMQNLDTPMMADTAYALAVDVAAPDGTNNAVLTIARGNGTCVPAGTLAVTPAIPAGMGWQTYCFVITPSSDTGQIMLQGSTSLGNTLYVDNLREARDCEPQPAP